jgi:hypothetical protein
MRMLERPNVKNLLVYEKEGMKDSPRLPRQLISQLLMPNTLAIGPEFRDGHTR